MLLQCLVKVSELFGPRTGGACLDKEFLLGSLGSDATGVTFFVHLSKGVCKSCQSILPHGDGAFPAVHLPPSSKELSLQLHGHRTRRRHSPTPISE
jgi:hypothetical protein